MNQRADMMKRAEDIVSAYALRDSRAATMRAVRDNDFERLAPGAFTPEYPAPVVHNIIDTMARDFVASASPLPSFTCTPTSTLRDNAKKFAAKRTQILNSYVEYSKLAAQMPDAVDHYQTYGLIAGEVCADLDEKRPWMKILDGSQVYPVWGPDLCTVEAVVVSYSNEWALEAAFPAIVAEQRRLHQPIKGERIKVLRYETATRCMVWLPDNGGVILQDYENKLGKCRVVAVPRPSGKGDWHSVPKGAYDDLVYPQLAMNDLRLLTLAATDKAVNAPVVVPPDVPDVPFGPDAVIHTNNPAGAQRLRIDVPPQGLQMSQVMGEEIQAGGMSPGSRSGSVNASVITGRGIEALGEGYSSQLALARTRLALFLRHMSELCFEMDEKFWPEHEKEIRGQELDTAFKVTYKPSKDIAGDYSVTVDYGFMLGLDPNRALVFILQAQAAGLMSTDTASRNLPVKLNLTEEVSKVQLEQLRGSLIQALAGLAQATPQFIAQGQDPSAIIAKYVLVMEGVKKGEEIEAVAAKVFAPPPPPESAPGVSGTAPAAPGSEQPGGGGLPSGMNPSLATEGPNARPDLQQMFAGLTSAGNPNLSGVVSRMNPVQGQ